jgi:hypothetical protein
MEFVIKKLYPKKYKILLECIESIDNVEPILYDLIKKDVNKYLMNLYKYAAAIDADYFQYFNIFKTSQTAYKTIDLKPITKIKYDKTNKSHKEQLKSLTSFDLQYEIFKNRSYQYSLYPINFHDAKYKIEKVQKYIDFSVDVYILFYIFEKLYNQYVIRNNGSRLRYTKLISKDMQRYRDTVLQKYDTDIYKLNKNALENFIRYIEIYEKL